MRLEPLYMLRFRYPEDWQVDLTGPGGKEEQHFYIAEGTCSGSIAGRFRAANHPRRRTDRTFVTDLQGVIETADGAVIMVDIHGYGRPYPQGRRQFVGAVWHLSEHENYKRLNDVVCTLAGEVRVPDIPAERLQQIDVELVCDVSELIWEAPAG